MMNSKQEMQEMPRHIHGIVNIRSFKYFQLENSNKFNTSHVANYGEGTWVAKAYRASNFGHNTAQAT